MWMDLTEEEATLIREIRKNKLLKKAIFNYFEAMSGLKLSSNGDDG